VNDYWYIPLAQRAADYHNNIIRSNTVWLQAQTEGEELRQSLVYEIQSQIHADENLSSPLLSLGTALWTITILRHPDWESEDNFIEVTDSGISMDGDTIVWDMPATDTEYGTSDGRISKLLITPDDEIQQLWIGIHPAYNGYDPGESGTPFDPVWEPPRDRDIKPMIYRFWLERHANFISAIMSVLIMSNIAENG
jgi:hypothetical protein